MAKVYLQTYGCQQNKADGEQLAGLLHQSGNVLVNNLYEADTVIVNTCAVKLKTQNKELHFIKNIPKDKQIIVGGCLTKVIDVRKHVGNVDALFDTNSITKINDIIENPRDTFRSIHENKINIPRIRLNKEIGILPIEEGCLSNCSFCGTKLARGNLTSYRIGDIKRELESAVKDGCKKIYLTGQDTGCYGFDIGTNLPELLEELVTIPGNYKIRVGMANPWHIIKILPRLIEAYKSDKIVKFIHIPVQSGSEKVTRDMRRIHTVEEFKKIVSAFRKEFPGITISTDIIIGYPEEDLQDFEDTIRLIEETKPEVLNISKYSAMHGTKASKLKQLPSQEIKRRSEILTRVYQEIKAKGEISLQVN